jgi:hypothetical protein
MRSRPPDLALTGRAHYLARFDLSWGFAKGQIQMGRFKNRVMRVRHALVACALVAGLVGAAGARPAAAGSDVVVPARAGPVVDSGSGAVDTGVSVAGSVTVSATGTINGSTNPSFGQNIGPNGTGVCSASCPLPGVPEWAVIAEIGSGPWQLVGAGPTILSGNGELFLAVDDDYYGDNSGQFTAAISTGPACTTTYTGSDGGNWDTSWNWSTGLAPGPTDVACLGGHTVDVAADGTDTVEAVENGSLDEVGGTFIVTGTSDPSDLDGGSLTLDSSRGFAQLDFEGTGANLMTVGSYVQTGGNNASTGLIDDTGNFAWNTTNGTSQIAPLSSGGDIEQTNPAATASISGTNQQLLYRTQLGFEAPLTIDSEVSDGYSQAFGSVVTAHHDLTLTNTVVNNANGASPPTGIVVDGTLHTTGTSGVDQIQTTVNGTTDFAGDVHFDRLDIAATGHVTVPAVHQLTAASGTIAGELDGEGTADLATDGPVDLPAGGSLTVLNVDVGAGTLTVDPESHYSVPGKTDVTGDLSVGADSTTGSLDITNLAAHVHGTNTLAVNGDIDWTGGAIGNGSNDLTLTQAQDNVFRIEGSAPHYLYGSTVTTASPVIFSATDFDTAFGAALTTTSTFDDSSGALFQINGGDNAKVTAGGFVAPANPSSAYGTAADDLELTGGTTTFPFGQMDVGNLTVDSGATVVADGLVDNTGQITVAGGTLRGTGTLESLANPSGTVYPGDPSTAPGTLSTGSYTQGASGTLAADVDAGGHDLLQVIGNGTASLAGTLAGHEMNGFGPTSPDQIAVVTATGTSRVNGTFATVGGTPANAQYSASYDAQNAYLTVLGGGTAVPANQASPSIPAGPQVGVPITATPGAWSPWDPVDDPATDTASYQWLSCFYDSCSDATGPGADTATYTPVVADLGHMLGVTVTARNANGTSWPATGNYSGPVTNGPDAPTAHTGGAVAIAGSSASLLGVIDTSAGHPATYHFDWGATSAYGHQTAALNAGDDSENVVGADVKGLQTGATYHYRLVVDNDSGESLGQDRAFTTLGPQPTTQPLQIDPPQGFGLEPVTVTPGDPGDGPDSAWVEWGIDPANLANATPAQPIAAGPISFGPLVPGTTYYFRLAAHDAQGTARGAVLSTTASSQRSPTSTSAEFEQSAHHVGQSPVLDITVASPSGPAPTGTVTITQNSAPVASGVLTNGQARVTLPAIMAPGRAAFDVAYAGDSYDAPSGTTSSYTATVVVPIIQNLTPVLAVGTQADEFQATVVEPANLPMTIHVGGDQNLDLPPDWSITVNGTAQVQFTVNGISSSTPAHISLSATLDGVTGTSSVTALAEGTSGLSVTTNTNPETGMVLPISTATGSCSGHNSCTVTLSVPAGSAAATGLATLEGQRVPDMLASMGYKAGCPATRGSPCGMVDPAPVEWSNAQFAGSMVTASGKSSLTFTSLNRSAKPARLVLPPLYPATIHSSAGNTPAASVWLLEAPTGSAGGAAFLTRAGHTLPTGPGQAWSLLLGDGETINLTGVKASAYVTSDGSAHYGAVPPGGYNVYVLSYTGRALTAPGLPALAGRPRFTSTSLTVHLTCGIVGCHAQIQLRSYSTAVSVTMKPDSTANFTLPYTTAGKSEYATLQQQHQTVQATLAVTYTGQLGDRLAKNYPVTFP